MPNQPDQDASFSLTYLDCSDIFSAKKKLEEPSGLALHSDRSTLWTVSDDTKALFQMSLDGKLEATFKLDKKGLEGLTVGPDKKTLVAVREDGNEVITIPLPDDTTKKNSKLPIETKPLDAMENYDSIQDFFTDHQKDKNKGLEGIAWHPVTETYLLLKEGLPGLLIEVSADLSKIISHRVLNHLNGFHGSSLEADVLDFSDLCYDESRERFWIISDQARTLYLYDWSRNQVIQQTKLGYGQKGRYREVSKAEGVAIDPPTKRLYIVSDDQARLYVFDLRGAYEAPVG